MFKQWFIALVIGIPGLAMADSYSHDYGSRDDGSHARSSKVAIPSNPLYQTECGSCHFAFQANLLPSASWKKMMLPSSLANHFGDNTELAEKDRQDILAYLVTNAADKAGALLRYPRSEAPLRITALPYFRKEHREIPRRMVQDNPGVRSLSNCLACHTDAAEGLYRERNIRIPNYGRWDD